MIPQEIVKRLLEAAKLLDSGNSLSWAERRDTAKLLKKVADNYGEKK